MNGSASNQGAHLQDTAIRGGWKRTRWSFIFKILAHYQEVSPEDHDSSQCRVDADMPSALERVSYFSGEHLKGMNPLVMYAAWLKPESQARPGPNKPGRARPFVGLEAGSGPGLRA